MGALYCFKVESRSGKKQLRCFPAPGGKASAIADAVLAAEDMLLDPDRGAKTPDQYTSVSISWQRADLDSCEDCDRPCKHVRL